MSTIGLILLCAGAGFFAVQAILVAQFFFVLRRRPRKYVFKDSPSVAILLSIRGNDPSLVKCVKSIATQEYTNLTLVVVADDEHGRGRVETGR